MQRDSLGYYTSHLFKSSTPVIMYRFYLMGIWYIYIHKTIDQHYSIYSELRTTSRKQFYLGNLWLFSGWWTKFDNFRRCKKKHRINNLKYSQILLYILRNIFSFELRFTNLFEITQTFIIFYWIVITLLYFKQNNIKCAPINIFAHWKYIQLLIEMY